MKKLLKKYENKSPEIVFEWKDSMSNAEGWVVINSLRGGACGGGTRMRKGLNKYEVLSLAKIMEVKFSVCGPQIGGAKSGINFDPLDPRKKDVLKRWFKAVSPLLKSYYGTGGDLNVDEVHEVIPMTEDCGVWHPQEGVFSGHYSPNAAEKINRIGQLRYGVKKRIDNKKYTPDLNKNYVIADMITGYGVAESVKHYYKLWGGDLRKKRVIIQGWGNVASAAAYYLSQLGASIIGIIDKNSGQINENGFSFEEIKQFFLNKKGNKFYSSEMESFKKINKKIWDLDADIFIPGAASRIVTKEQISRLIKSGLELVSAGANIPFADEEVFYGPTSEFCDNKISIIPDFISNCGMARAFDFLMSGKKEITDDSVFKDCSRIIKKALKDCYNVSSKKTRINSVALEIALKKLLK